MMQELNYIRCGDYGTVNSFAQIDNAVWQAPAIRQKRWYPEAR